MVWYDKTAEYPGVRVQDQELGPHAVEALRRHARARHQADAGPGKSGIEPVDVSKPEPLADGRT